MTELIGGVAAAADSTGVIMAPPPPATQRRPRVREVSSRFMSPLISSPNPSDLSKSGHRRQSSKSDENHAPETNRSSEKASDSVLLSVQRKQPPKTVKRENVRASARPDTPVAVGADRVVPSRYRKVSNTPISGSNSLSSSGCGAVTAAARLLQEATCDVEKKLSRISTSSGEESSLCSSSSNQGSSSCPNSPLCVSTSKARSVPDTRSSMSDMDRWFAEKNSHNHGKVSGDCARSLNFASSAKVGGGGGGGVSLPPHPSSYMRSGFEVKKGRGASTHQEDVHSLKMLTNHLLQWRFANAKAEACARAQKQEAERKLYSLGCKISDLRDNVNKKRKELAVLRAIKTLSTVVEDQMPYLDEWSALEEDYSSSVSGTTNALLNSSARLPVSGEVRADPKELGEAMGSAINVVELIASQIQRFMGKAEEMDTSISELAKMAGGERSLIEECGDLLSKTYSSEVIECSLRGSIIQLQANSPHQHQTSEVLLQT